MTERDPINRARSASVGTSRCRSEASEWQTDLVCMIFTGTHWSGARMCGMTITSALLRMGVPGTQGAMAPGERCGEEIGLNRLAEPALRPAQGVEKTAGRGT